MTNKEKPIGEPAEDQAPIVSETAKILERGIIYPRCPFCPQDEETTRQDGTRPGDPLRLWRLRYDWPDGVVAEVLYCQDCRAFIGAQIVGVTPVARKS